MATESQIVSICLQRGGSIAACWDNAGTPTDILINPSFGADGLPVVAGTVATDGSGVDIGFSFTDLEGNVLPGVAVSDVTVGACPVQRTASFSDDVITAIAPVTVPADTYSITIFNTSSSDISFDVGGDVQVVPSNASHNFYREYENEQPFATTMTPTIVSGSFLPGESVFFNFKSIV